MFVQPRRVRGGAAMALIFASVLVTGFATGSWGSESNDGERRQDGAPIRPKTVAEVPENDAHELVSRSGDRWSAAYTAREYEGLRKALDGEYVGVGIAVKRGRDGEVKVARVTEDSPAERAGVRRGDRLRSIDGADVTGFPVTEVVARLRGGDERGDEEDGGAEARDGSRVELGLSRAGRAWDEQLRRTRLDTEAVTVEKLGQGARRIAVSAFTKDSGAQVREAVAKVPQGAGILLDLRGNSGGLVKEATTAASAFLDGGLVATYGDDTDTQRALYADPGGNTAAPLVVLVDGGSMSAAELLAGALQDRGRAVIVGSRTFGKGSVQMPKEQPDGSVAELTVGQYTTPAGRRVDGEGLTPDVAVRKGERAQDKARTVLSGLAARD